MKKFHFQEQQAHNAPLVMTILLLHVERGFGSVTHDFVTQQLILDAHGFRFDTQGFLSTQNSDN